MQSKHQFFRKGVTAQRKADITIDLKRPNIKDVSKWTEEEKKELKDWLLQCNKTIISFVDTLLKA